MCLPLKQNPKINRGGGGLCALLILLIFSSSEYFCTNGRDETIINDKLECNAIGDTDSEN